MSVNPEAKVKPVRDLTTIKTPHTYAIIFFVVIFFWLLTFIVPAGMFETHDIHYTDASGKVKTRTVLMPDTFRYQYALDRQKLQGKLKGLNGDQAKLDEIGVKKADLDSLLQADVATWDQSKLDAIGLTDPVIYKLFSDSVYDTSQALHKTATIWGTDDYYGFGVLNYLFEGLVTGDKYGSAVGIVALILVVGGAFGVIMRTGAVDAGIFAFVNKTRGAERFALPLLFFLFSLGGAVFGMSEECIPFAMVMVPFVIALGYDSIVAVTVTFVAAQIGNGTSWMSPFSTVIAQGIAGIPILSGASFRLTMWMIVTAAGAAYLMRYGAKIKKNPKVSVMYEADNYFRERIAATEEDKREFNLGHKLILLTLLAGLIWIIWGVTEEGYYIPEIASQFFVMGFVSGVVAIIFKLNGMTINEMATAFQRGTADLAGTAIVVGMAKGILLVLGGSNSTTPTALNTLLHGVGKALVGLPSTITALFMYVFQSIFNIFVTSNSGQAALTMPIMAPLSDIVGVTRQVAVLAYQMGAGFVDAITPTSASLIGVLGVARVDWFKWAKFQIKMQGFLFVLGCFFIIIAVSINLQ
jgi:uncharacterized ion transporter superfamily protein YfcC